jgi:hypothetical protein
MIKPWSCRPRGVSSESLSVAVQAIAALKVRAVGTATMRSLVPSAAQLSRLSGSGTLDRSAANVQTMYVPGGVNFINLRGDDTLHEYTITDEYEYEQVARSMLRIWRHREHDEDQGLQSLHFAITWSF